MKGLLVGGRKNKIIKKLTVGRGMYGGA